MPGDLLSGSALPPSLEWSHRSGRNSSGWSPHKSARRWREAMSMMTVVPLSTAKDDSTRPSMVLIGEDSGRTSSRRLWRVVDPYEPQATDQPSQLVPEWKRTMPGCKRILSRITAVR